MYFQKKNFDSVVTDLRRNGMTWLQKFLYQNLLEFVENNEIMSRIRYFRLPNVLNASAISDLLKFIANSQIQIETKRHPSIRKDQFNQRELGKH